MVEVGVFELVFPPDCLGSDADRLETTTDQAISACGGNARDAVKALLVANEYLEAELREVQRSVSVGYARGYTFGRFKTYSGGMFQPCGGRDARGSLVAQAGKRRRGRVPAGQAIPRWAISATLK